MDGSERLVADYLSACGFADIQYEPDGKVSPDFLCDGHVAVEVRRLNQNHDDGSGSRGLEEAAILLSKRIRKLLVSFGPPTRNQSWFVGYRFSRPVPEWRALRAWIERELKSFMAAADPHRFEKTFGDNFEVIVFPASVLWPTFFVPTGYTDGEAGGFLIGEIEKNLRLCIAEKTKKIAKVREKYPVWWLVLPDHIGYGLDDDDQQQFRAEVSLVHNFNKVVLLDPRDHNRTFVI